MTDPELLKLARHARTALWVIAGSSAVIALNAAASMIPPLASFLGWFFSSPIRVGLFASAVIVAVLVGVIHYLDSAARPRATEDR